MFKTIINAFKIKDIRNKILLTLLLLLIYRLGCWIPAIGFDAGKIVSTEGGFSIFNVMDMVSGGALTHCSILALGVTPYITASIVIQLLTVAIPPLERLAKSGEDGRRKINLYTRIAALVLALAQSIGIVVGFAGEGSFDANVLWQGAPDWLIGTGLVLILTAGGMFTVWLGERITDLGIGNGVSLLIFVGILSSAAGAIKNVFAEIFGGKIELLWTVAIYVVAVIAVFALIVFVDGAERRVPVQYAKQIKGRKMYGGQSTYIPIRVNGSGVMPIILASTFISFPQLVLQIFWKDGANWWAQWFGTNSWLYIVLTALLILLFSFFYSKITFDPNDVSKRIQQQGGFIPGIRAGKPTAEYLGKISGRVTLFGAIFLAAVALIPSLAFKAIGTSNAFAVQLINAFSVTGLMIVVSVALELDKQLDAQMLMRNYKGFLN